MVDSSFDKSMDKQYARGNCAESPTEVNVSEILLSKVRLG